jgi:hypothetical protein
MAFLNTKETSANPQPESKVEPVEPAPGTSPGEFTQAFLGSKASPPEAQLEPEPQPERKETGDFSMWFKSAQDAAREQKARRERTTIQRPPAAPPPKIDIPPAPPRREADTVVPSSSTSPPDGGGLFDDDSAAAWGRVPPPRPSARPEVDDFDLKPLPKNHSDLDPLPALEPLPGDDDWAAPEPARRDNSYTVVIDSGRRPAPSSAPAKPGAQPGAAPNAARGTQPGANDEKWYWVSLLVLGIVAFTIVLVFSIRSWVS